MEIVVGGGHIVVVAVLVWYLGSTLNARIALLRRYSIPVAVTGGLFCSLAVTLLFYATGWVVTFDTALRDLLLLAFFSTIGLSARISILRAGGRALVLVLAAAAVLLVLQNLVGVALASFLGGPPGLGLFGGSIALAGGHGTAIAWGQVAEEAGIAGAKEIGIAFATLGLICGGIIGGPIAERLIRGHALKAGGGRAIPDPGAAEPVLQPPISSALTTLMLLAVCIEAGGLVNQFLSLKGMTLPGFLTAMLVGIAIVNLADLAGVELDETTRAWAGDISLQLFLAMSLMSMQLWVLAGALSGILLILFAQTVLIALFGVFVLFRLVGRDYDAAVIVAGFTGLGMGATPVGIANMTAVTAKYGASPKAFLVVPLVGAFFLDLVNAVVIKAFLAWPLLHAH